MKKLSEKVTVKYFGLLRNIYDLTNNVGFQKVNLNVLIKDLRLSNCGNNQIKEFLIEDNSNSNFFKWRSIDCPPTIKDAENLHNKIINDYRLYIKKKKIKEGKIKNRIISNMQTEHTYNNDPEAMVKTVQIIDYSIDEIFSELKRRGISGNYTVSITKSF